MSHSEPPPGAVPPLTPPPTGRGALAASLTLAVAGMRRGGQADEGVVGMGTLRNPQVAVAFASDATVQAADCGPGLWSLLRTSADGAARILCVHNVTEQIAEFRPGNHLATGRASEAELLFLAGAVSTAEAGGSLVCRLAPYGFVWFGVFAGPGRGCRYQATEWQEPS